MISWILLLLVLLVSYTVYYGGTSTPEELDALEIQTFTPEKLVKFNGNDDARILMAIKGKVYDVTAGRNHYGPGGPYASFAGRDASRALAKHSFDLDLLTPVDQPVDTLDDLSSEELAALDQWIGFMSAKYPYCGEFGNE